MDSDSTPVRQIQRSTDLLRLLFIQMMLLYLYTLLTACRFTGPLVLNVAIVGLVHLVLTIFQQLWWFRTSPALIFSMITISQLLFRIILIGTWLILIN